MLTSFMLVIKNVIDFFVREALTCYLSLANKIFERKGLILHELKMN